MAAHVLVQNGVFFRDIMSPLGDIYHDLGGQFVDFVESGS